MGSHPVNLAIRFLLEIAALLAMGIWGWGQGDYWWRYLLAFGVPITAALVWGVFNVPNDPSRSGSAPIAVPGFIRLTIELSIFAFAIWALRDLDQNRISFVLGLIIVIHYILSYDRILWLFRQHNHKGSKNDNNH